MSAMEMDKPSGVHSRTGFMGIRQMGIRACGTCVKAKVKCVPNTQKGKCQRYSMTPFLEFKALILDRCHRLDKVCQPALTPSRKRPT